MRKFIIFLSFIIMLSIVSCGQSKKEANEQVIANVDINAYSQTQAEKVFPRANNVEMAKKKKLISKSCTESKYLKLQAVYMAALNYYLNVTCDLDNYQILLDNNPLSFDLEKEQEDNIYKYFGGFGRKNLYIRNNVYIEYLSEDDLDLLQRSVKFGKLSITDSLLDMIRRTFKHVITVRYDDSGTVFDVVYQDGVIFRYVAPNTALVFELCYGTEYDAQGNIVSQEIEDEKDVISGYLKDVIESELKHKLEMEVKVFINN